MDYATYHLLWEPKTTIDVHHGPLNFLERLTFTRVFLGPQFIFYFLEGKWDPGYFREILGW